MNRSFKQVWLGLWMVGFCIGSTAAAPVNDNFADRIVVSGEKLSVVGSTLGGSLEENEPPTFHILSTVWYEWVAPKAGSVAVSVDGSPHTVLVHVRKGIALDGLQYIAMVWSTAERNIDVEEGVTYQFQVGPNQPVPFPRFEGPFTLRVEYNVRPPNDDFADRIRLTNAIERITFRNVLATIEPWETPISWSENNSVWYEWQAPQSGMANIVIDNGQSLAVGIYSANPPTAGNLITNSQIDAGNCWTEVSFPVVAGHSYPITFDNCNHTPGNKAATLTLNGAARLDVPRMGADGVVEMNLFGERYRSYVLEASSDLSQWSPISTNAYYLPMVLQDTAGSNSRRFYRVRRQ